MKPVLDETHDPKAQSWVESATPGASELQSETVFLMSLAFGAKACLRMRVWLPRPMHAFPFLPIRLRSML